MRVLNLKCLLVCFAFALAWSPVQAGFFFEPHAAYEFGSMEGNVLLTGTPPLLAQTDSKLAGAAAGAKLGWQFKTFGFGLEGQMSQLKLKEEGGGEKTDFTSTNVGLYLRWRWTNFQLSTAFLTSTAKDESLKLMGMDETLKGSGMRFGIGYRLYKDLFINLDITDIKYDKTDEPTILAINADRTTTMIGFSMPFGDNQRRR